MPDCVEQLSLELWPQETEDDWERSDADVYRRWGLSGRLPLRGAVWDLPEGTGWWQWVPPQWGHADDGTPVSFEGYRIRPDECICDEKSYVVSLNGHNVLECPANPWNPAVHARG